MVTCPPALIPRDAVLGVIDLLRGASMMRGSI
jgi:hypothetical protein